jgi:Dyp-type peroxidase family
MQSGKRRLSWQLAECTAFKTQGIVVSGFVDLPWAEALFLHAETCGAAWIDALRAAAPITNAAGKEKGERAAVLAFTCSGLARVGLSDRALETFSLPFREGMYQEDRLRRLGDKIDGKWQGTVISEGPIWGGNVPCEPPATATPTTATPSAATLPTPVTVHALLLLYDDDQADVRRWAAEVKQALAPFRVEIVRQLSLDLRIENGIGREHFGFADGLSQPIPFGPSVILSDGSPSERDRWHGVPLGEILLGHDNAHSEKAPGPLVPDNGISIPGLTTKGAPEGFLNFGLNGSYMVVRELRQYVAAFWNSLKTGAERIRAHDPNAAHVTADWLAERVVGRNTDGHLLCPSGFLAAQEKLPQNDFGFMRDDPHGHGCPPGSHVRRANPRDGLAKNAASAQTLLDASNNHRILRRGRNFGPPVEDRYQDDQKERGLLFICLNSDIARQFEFVQQNWILNRNFATLFDESDPLVGPKGPFTIREQPLRRIVEVETFVQAAGGEYFFLPSIPALDYLGRRRI